MEANQPTNDDSKKRRRNSHPETSHDSAKKIKPFLGELQIQALDFIRAYPDRTQSEIDQIAGNTRRVLGKRFNELEAVGMIEGKFKRRCTVTGSMARIYRVCAMKPGADIVQRDLFEGKGD